jgi:hypothetical protein
MISKNISIATGLVHIEKLKPLKATNLVAPNIWLFQVIIHTIQFSKIPHFSIFSIFSISDIIIKDRGMKYNHFQYGYKAMSDILITDWIVITYRTIYLSILLYQYPLFFIIQYSLSSFFDPLYP